MVDIFSDDENLERFYVVHRNVRIIPKGLISYMVLTIQHCVHRIFKKKFGSKDFLENKIKNG